MVEFPYGRPRVGQIELAKFIVDRAGDGTIILVEAPTGFGKTVSVLYAFAELVNKGVCNRVFYAVRTRNELDPVVKECRRLGLRFTVLYSIKKMCPIAKNASISSEGFWAVCTILRLRGECKYYAKLFSVSDGDVLSILSEPYGHTSIARNIAERAKACPYFTLLRLAEKADIIALTYPYIFKESIWASTFRDADTSRAALVVDESHNLLNIGGVMGESMSLRDVERALSEVLIAGAEVQEVADFLDFLKSLLAVAIEKAGERGCRYLGKDALGIDRALADRASKLVFNAIVKALKGFENRLDISKLDFSLSRISRLLQAATEEDYDVFVVKGQSNAISIAALPVNFNPLNRSLGRFPTAVLMSGTPPSAEFVSKCVGVSKIVHTVDVEDFGARNCLRENTFTVIFTGATTSYRARGERTFKLYRDLIETVYRSTPLGVVMAVYPSHEVMQRVVSGIDVDSSISEGLEPVSELVERLVLKDKVLLNVVAGGRLTEGVEFVSKGESLVKAIVVVGIPYPQPDDYTETIKRSLVSRSSSHMDYYKDVAMVRVVQAIGRAVRGEDDRALVVLADRRYADASILKRLKLTPKAITKSVDRVSQLVAMFFGSHQR